MVPAKEQHHQSHDGDHRQHKVISAEKAPGGASVAPVHELKKPIDHDLFLGVSKKADYDVLGQLIKHDHRQRNHGNASIRCPNQKIQWCHSKGDWRFNRGLDKKTIHFASKAIDLAARFVNFTAPLNKVR